jgi:hypothetical protein
LDPEWHEVMVNPNLEIFEMSYEESVSYFKHLKNLEKIRHTNGPAFWLYHRQIMRTCKSVTNSVFKTSKNPKVYDMWSHYCDMIRYNTADCRAITKFKQQKKAHIEAKSGLGIKSLTFLFGENNLLKRQLKPEKTATRSTFYFFFTF